VWETHQHDHDHSHEQKHDHGHDHDGAHDVDGHIWLDPENAKAIVKMAEIALSEVDPTNAATYTANAKALTARIEVLDQELRTSLGAVKDRPFVVFHDGYQYLEARYDLNAVGSITVSPDRMPGAKRIGEIKDKVKSLKAACVFAEPQFEPKLVQTLIQGTDAKTGTLDPEASTLPAGPNLYFDLMRGLAANLTACLKAN
jgi:zinc transport system substrate-binding protein